MYQNEVNALIAAANDARHCLAAVNDEALKGSINRTITSLEQTIANLQKCYCAVPTPTLPAMGWVKSLPRPTSSKDAFVEMREAEANAMQAIRGNEWPY